MTKRNSKTNEVATPKLNGKHSIVIRMGASEDSITIDGHKTDIARRRPQPQHAENGKEESFKDYLGRRQRISNDLVGLAFS